MKSLIGPPLRAGQNRLHLVPKRETPSGKALPLPLNVIPKIIRLTSHANEQLILCRESALAMKINALRLGPIWAWLHDENLLQLVVPRSVQFLRIVDTKGNLIPQALARKARQRFKAQDRSIQFITV